MGIRLFVFLSRRESQARSLFYKVWYIITVVLHPITIQKKKQTKQNKKAKKKKKKVTNTQCFEKMPKYKRLEIAFRALAVPNFKISTFLSLISFKVSFCLAAIAREITENNSIPL